MKRKSTASGIDSTFGLTDEEIYTIIMLRRYQRLDINKIARRFGITAAQVRKLIARRTRSDCCG